MDLKRHIEKIVADQLNEKEFLVDVVIAGANAAGKILILVDGDEGITIDRCAEISRRTGATLEEQETMSDAYVLEVSSPGLEHPLKLMRQYKKNIGRTVKVTTADDIIVKGELAGVNDQNILVRESKKEKGKKKLTVNDLTIPFSEIKKTNVLVSFK